MVLPQFNSLGYLPDGEYAVTLKDIEQRFGCSNVRRRTLMHGLKLASKALFDAGVTRIYVDGSFVSDKENPNDIDGCWSFDASVNLDKLDPIFVCRNSRFAVKRRYGLDLFIAESTEASTKTPFPKFFRTSKDGNAKGILLIKRVIGNDN